MTPTANNEVLGTTLAGNCDCCDETVEFYRLKGGLCAPCRDETKAANMRDAIRELHSAGLALVPHMGMMPATVAIRWDNAMTAAIEATAR